MAGNSIFLAQMIGPSLSMVCFTETLNSDIWAENTAVGVYLNGAMLFASGLAIVLNHNVWTLRWEGLVTAVGWAALTMGASRMMAPRAALAGAKRGTRATMMVVTVPLFVVGAILTGKGFGLC